VLIVKVHMNMERVYSYLIDSTWFFLGGWVVLLLTAGVAAFAPTEPDAVSRR
jgi:hypothetical protein